MSYEQGDIVLVPFPYTNGMATKVRPAIVVSNGVVNSSEDVILAQISSTARLDKFTFKLSYQDLECVLQKESQVRCHKIFVTEKHIILKKISKLKLPARKRLSKQIISILEVEG